MRKERPILFSTDMVQAILEGRKIMTRRMLKKKLPDNTRDYGVIEGNLRIVTTGDPFIRTICKCPYGQPGDILWVRETWMFAPNYPDLPDKYYFKASKSQQYLDEWAGHWKPSIFMPKAAARIWLEITDIRVEQLFKITREDAISEGCGNEGTDYPEGNFYALWRKINGIESYQSNPWVWVISFKVLSTTGRPHEKLGPF